MNFVCWTKFTYKMQCVYQFIIVCLLFFRECSDNTVSSCIPPPHKLVWCDMVRFMWEAPSPKCVSKAKIFSLCNHCYTGVKSNFCITFCAIRCYNRVGISETRLLMFIRLQVNWRHKFDTTSHMGMGMGMPQSYWIRYYTLILARVLRYFDPRQKYQSMHK